MKRVFLGGTCNESPWRDNLIAMLKIDYFNPVVEDWTPECQVEELRQRESCDFCLYTITPRMTGVYSIAEVVDDSNKRAGRTVFCVLAKDGEQEFTPGQLRSLAAVAAMVRRNGGQSFTSLEECAGWLNCETCGQPVRVVSDREGTNYYEPDEIIAVREALRRLRVLALWRNRELPAEQACKLLGIEDMWLFKAERLRVAWEDALSDARIALEVER